MIRFFASLAIVLLSLSIGRAEVSVGAAIVDVTPLEFPVYVNGGMTSRSISEVNTPISARAIVIDDGTQRIAIVVVDSCMMPLFLLDDAKALAAKRTKIKADHILISATHTHSAPSSMGALGTPADPNYVPYLREKLAESIATAEANLQPAHVGWGIVNADKFTALRRWIRRPDRVDLDPFGNPTVRANMHSARVPENVTGPSGPEDPDLTMISFASPDGKPIAVLANFSMHYFSDTAISADYFGLFCNDFQTRIKQRQEGESEESDFVAVLSHGCSGDIWRRDYSAGPNGDYDPTIIEYARELLDVAFTAYDGIEYKPVESIGMLEARLPMRYRTPDAQRLEWAQKIVDELDGELPKTRPQIYAREQVILNELQSTEVVVQGIRIGDIGITTTPNETYALTGLKVKLQSPLMKQMVIELANGGDGYIPPPEQHHLGGYNTWAARSAGLEVTAEPRIAEASLQLMERLTDEARRDFVQGHGRATEVVVRLQPSAFYRLDHMQGSIAYDSSGIGRDASVSPGYALFLEGPTSERICPAGEINRCMHLAGGRITTRLPRGSSDYSVSMWFWNGMPSNGREVTGWLVSRDRDHQTSPSGDSLGISGTANEPGRLMFQHGDTVELGKTEVERWKWHQVVLTRSGDSVQVYLDAAEEPEIEVQCDAGGLTAIESLFLGGHSDNNDNFEGRLDEIAVFNRALTDEEISKLLAK